MRLARRPLRRSGMVHQQPRLAKWEGPSDRLDYYRGHRAGYEARMRKTRFIGAS